jgi:hypothetical protein
VDYTAEIFDQVQRLFDVNGFNDHELHGVLKFERPLDPEILKKAVIASIEAIPILGARYVDGARPRWTSLDPVDYERAVFVAPTEAEFEAFVVSKVDEGLGPDSGLRARFRSLRGRIQDEPHDLRRGGLQAISRYSKQNLFQTNNASHL